MADPDPRRELGGTGEALAAGWYEAAGYRVLDRNWRCRDGELDLVLGSRGARGRTLVVFCEVKTRRGARFGAPFEAVTTAKQRRLRKLAARWLADHRDARPHGHVDVRFDVASVQAARGQVPVVDVIEGAF